MLYRVAKLGLEYPALEGDAHARFMYELANVSHVAVTIYKGELMDNNSAMSMHGQSHFLGWIWPRDCFMAIGRREANPEPEFAAFIHDVCMRLCLVPYKDDENARKEFEEVLAGRCSLTKATNGKYAFAAQIAYEMWLKVYNKGSPYAAQ